MQPRSAPVEASAPPPPLAAVACPSVVECVAVGGSGVIDVSDDSASHWAAVVPTDHYLFGVACQSSATCVAVGDAGTVLVSHDGLRRWDRVESGTGVPLSSVTCQSSGTCFAVGDDGTIIATRDSGEHWEVSHPGIEVINGAACGHADECVAVTSGAEQVLRTTDGTGWTMADVHGGPLLALLSMNGVACSPPTCVSVGVRGTIGYSQDDGASWSFDDAQITGQTLNGVSCRTAELCDAVGAGGTVLATADGGATWTQLPSPTSETLLAVDCQETGPCVAVGDGGTVLVATGPSQPWQLREGAAVPGGTPIEVLVVGDSFAHTVALYVGRDASPYGVSLVDGGIDGCSLARGDTLSLPAGGPCAPSGPGWAANYEQDVDQYRPDVSLLILGPWDLSARLIEGQWLSPGQPAFDTYYAGQLSSAIRILSARGGRVAIATAPHVLMLGPELCVPPPATVPACPTEADRVQALDEIAQQVASDASGRVTVIDLGQHLSPNGKFTPTVDGVVVRAVDGVHLSQPGGEWLAPWLLPQLVTAERAPA